VARPLPRSTPMYQLRLTLKDAKAPSWRRFPDAWERNHAPAA
jgi:hypothetical protein